VSIFRFLCERSSRVAKASVTAVPRLYEVPTASGKGVGFVIPWLPDWEGPIHVYDPKADGKSK